MAVAPLFSLPMPETSTETSETAMAIALRKGGVKLPGEKFADLCKDACRTFSKRSGQRKHVADAVRGEMIFAFLEQWKPALLGEAIGVALDRAQAAIDAETMSANPDSKPESAAAARMQAMVKSEARPEPEPIVFVTPEPYTKWDKEGKFANDESRAATRANALFRTAVKLSKLDDFRVNGQPIGDVTPEEANAWAASRERDARFVHLLTAGLPPGRPIRLSRKGDEADQLYAAAEEMRTVE